MRETKPSAGIQATMRDLERMIESRRSQIADLDTEIEDLDEKIAALSTVIENRSARVETCFTSSRTLAYTVARNLADKHDRPITIWSRRDVSTGLQLDYAVTDGAGLPIAPEATSCLRANMIAVLSPREAS